MLGALIAGPSKPENMDKEFVMKAAQASYVKVMGLSLFDYLR